MSTVTFTLTPPADFINANDRPHYHAKAKLTKAWRQAACVAVRAGFHPYRFELARVVVYYRFPNNRRREVSNLQPTSKAIVDGLVDALLLVDDDDKHVIGPDNRREYPNGPARVTVTIEETA